jgi:hypothetical protein
MKSKPKPQKPKGPSEEELRAKRDAERRAAEDAAAEERLEEQRRRRGAGIGAFLRREEQGLLRAVLGG